MSGQRHATRLLTAALVVGSGMLGFLPLAHASTTTTMTPSQEAWYQPNPTCAQASGCLTPAALPVALPAGIPLSPYPSGTLHVGFVAGQETARTYLALPVGFVTGTLVGATLDIPLDTAQADGSQSPETSKIQACLFTDPITQADGSIAAPPQPSCDTSAPVSYVAEPTPHLHADLAPLTQSLLTTTGIALLPDATKVAQTDAWRVVFSAHSRDDVAKTPPATVTLTLEEPSSEEPGPVTLPDQDDAGLGGIAPPIGTGFALAPTTEVQTAVPTTLQPSLPVTTPAALPRTIGYAYPQVWLLPLLVLVMVRLAGSALTRDLTPKS
jgi:hypothetical protein